MITRFIFIVLFINYTYGLLGIHPKKLLSHPVIDRFNQNDQIYAMTSNIFKQYSNVKNKKLADIFPKENIKTIDVTNVNRLPWTKSINPDRDLSYMPMLNLMLDKMKNMKMNEVTLDEKFQYCESNVKPAKIGNLCFENEFYRKIRITYFDAGDSVQVTNIIDLINFLNI